MAEVTAVLVVKILPHYKEGCFFQGDPSRLSHRDRFGWPLVCVDRVDPFEEGDQFIDLLVSEVLVGHLSPLGVWTFRILQKCPEPGLPLCRVGLGHIRRVVPSDAEDGMAIVAIVLVPDALSKDDFIRKLVRVSSFRDRSVGINGEPDENGSANDCSPDKEIPRTLLLHRNLLAKVPAVES